MTTMADVEQFVEVYALQRRALKFQVEALQAKVSEIKSQHLPSIREHAARLSALHAELEDMIREAPELFAKPRTRIVHGVKIGIQKRKGSVEWDDEDAVVERIRKLLPADQAELLIRVRRSVHKPAVYDLSAADLKRLGIRVVADGDDVVIRSTDDEVERFVDALLREGAEE